MTRFEHVSRLSLVLLLTLVATGQAVASPPSRASASRFVYTSSNAASGNTVQGFSIEEDGSLSPLPGSPYATGGLGQGDDLLVNSDSGIAASSDKRFLFVPNRGSNDISVFRIRRNGSLDSVRGSPFPTGGDTPVSVSVSGDVLFVAHQGSDGFPQILERCTSCDYRGFHIGRGGRLTPIEDGVVELSESPSSGPFGIRFSPDGRFLVGTELVSGNLNVLRVDQHFGFGDVEITPAPGSPFEGVGELPLGFLFNPANPSQLFVSNVGFAANSGTVASFLMADTGQVAPISLPAVVGRDATCWIEVTSDGKWLFSTDTNSDTVSTFSVAPDGQLSFVNTLLIEENGGIVDPAPAPIDAPIVSTVDMAMTEDDRFLYVLLFRSSEIVAFEVDAVTGALTQTSRASVEGEDAFPFGLVTVELGRSIRR